MSDYKIVEHIQGNPNKRNIGDFINRQAVSFAIQTGLPIKLLSLPSTFWGQEIGMIELCDKNGIKYQIIGVEGNPKYVDEFEKNAPEGAITHKGKLDIQVPQIFDENSKFYGCNTVYADYCSEVAKAKYDAETDKIRYSYPKVLVMKDFIQKATDPSLYYITLRCNGRVKGGRDKLQQAMSPNSSNFAAAIRNKIQQTLLMYGLSSKVTKILDVYYHGAGNSFMITLGYAINFKPKFDTYKLDLVKQGEVKKVKRAYVKKAYKVNKVEAINIKDLTRKAVWALIDLGMKKSEIAAVLKTRERSVQSILVWKDHRNSWVKSGRAGDIAKVA